MGKLRQRGLLAAARAVPLGPPPTREMVLHKGRSVGPTMPALTLLSELLRSPRPRPDFVLIDGVLYTKDEPLPPPFGAGAPRALGQGIFEPQEKLVFKSAPAPQKSLDVRWKVRFEE